MVIWVDLQHAGCDGGGVSSATPRDTPDHGSSGTETYQNNKAGDLQESLSYDQSAVSSVLLLCWAHLLSLHLPQGK